MRIAIVTETFIPRMDGVVRMLVEFLEYLWANNHEALIIAPGSGPSTYAGFPVLWVRGIPCPLYPDLTLAPFSLHLRPILRVWQPDLVHLATPFVLGAHAVRVANALNLPVVAHYQTDIATYARFYGLGAVSGLSWWHLAGLHRGCTLTLCPTETVRADLTARGIPRVGVLGRGVDTTLFTPQHRCDDVRRQLAPAGGPILLSVGRISPEKNLTLLAQVADACPQATLAIVGDGPARQAVEESMRGRRVQFLGYLSGQALAQVYASADLFLFPSLTETFGQVAQEAMASGVPVVAMRAGGLPDVVAHGETGLLCDPAHSDEFIAATSMLLNDPARCRRMAEQARQRMESRTWAAIFEALLDRYAALIAPQSQNRPPARWKGDSHYDIATSANSSTLVAW